MKKIISLALILSFTLTGCSFFRPHKLDIVQGNVITEENVGHLHAGMSEAQVKSVMGTPMMVNIFSANRLDYVYTDQPGHSSSMTEKRVTCTFVSGRLRDIQRG